MDDIMKFEHVDFNALVMKNNLDKSLNFRSKLVDTLNNIFTEDEKRWYVSIFYMYLNILNNIFYINIVMILK